MKNKKFYIPIAIFIAVFCVGMAKGFYKEYKADEIIVDKIEVSLNSNCNCETITKDMYSKGVQYSNDEGFSIEKVSFSLTNCEFTSLKEEANRIQQFLEKDVEDLCKFNLVTLDIISEDSHDTVTIRNGKLEQ